MYVAYWCIDVDGWMNKLMNEYSTVQYSTVLPEQAGTAWQCQWQCWCSGLGTLTPPKNNTM